MKIIFSKKTSCLLLFLIGIVLYSNTLSGGFVWDDHYLIEYNARLKTPAAIIDFFTKDFWQNSSIHFNSGFYRPVTLLTFFVNYNLWNGQPFGFHFFNVVLHSINGVLIFLILLYLTQNTFVSFISGLFFIIHPVQTEVVAYIADINDILLVFFLLLCWRYYLFFV